MIQPIVGRRWPWLVAIVGAAALLSLPIGAILGWLSPAVGMRGTLAFMLGLSLTLTAAGGALVVLVDQRPTPRVVFATLGGVAAVLLCGVPAGTFATFAVDHGPSGADCPECAVTTYLSAAPFAGFASDGPAFRSILCDKRRGELQRQADAMARDVRTVGSNWRKVSSADERVSTDGGQVTVTARISLDVGTNGTQTPGVTTWRYDWGAWTFSVVDDDGWRVCGLDAPQLCGEVLDCDRAAPTPSTSPTEDDLLQHPREMLPCGPRDPFRERRNCDGSPSVGPS